MELTEEQKQQVRQWVSSGDSLSQVQTKLKDVLGLDMTYLDVRLLVLDIGAEVKDKPEPKPPKPQEEAIEPDEEFEDEEELPENFGGANVNVSLDKIVVPGAMVSGEVVFSDGVKARWLIDQYGRFGLEAQDNPGYHPSEGDLQAFQSKLRTLLRQNGYA